MVLDRFSVDEFAYALVFVLGTDELVRVLASGALVCVLAAD